jgi:dCTP deaminase
MAVLSGAEIGRRLDTSNLDRRLVVAPLLEPNEQLKPSQASIDLRLGCEFALVNPSEMDSVDELELDTSGGALRKLYRKLYVPLGGKFVVHPHQLVLAQALEYLRLPGDLMAYVVGRSTWGRLGLTVATAVGVHPGFSGSLTLELRNLGEAPLALRPGQPIAQLFFHRVHVTGADTSVGQYRGSVDILPKRMSSERTRQKIVSLNAKHTNESLPVVSVPVRP